ncbi:MAG: VOC family protein [Alphaproteobacteria bacterium]|nr:VOC family protein [Alphaproteobacteria bacterium]
MGAIKIRGLDHVVLRVADLERSKAFYRDVLGCPEEKWQPDLGLLQMRAGSALIDLVDINGKLGQRGGPPAGAEGRNVDHFCVQLASFDEAALRAHLGAHGVAPGDVVQRYGAEGYGRSMYISDPDGNQVELKAPPE